MHSSQEVRWTLDSEAERVYSDNRVPPIACPLWLAPIVSANGFGAAQERSSASIPSIARSQHISFPSFPAFHAMTATVT